MTAFPNRLIVLLADDNHDDLHLIRAAFNGLGSRARLIVLSPGRRAMDYLRGAGRYSDRIAWPLPDVLLIGDSLAPGFSLEMLRWVRAEPRFASLPAVLLSSSGAQEELCLADQMKAACCVRPSKPAEVMQVIDEAITVALSLIRDCWFGSRTAYDLAEPALSEPAQAIRVWT